jgi:hexosaminidase
MQTGIPLNRTISRNPNQAVLEIHCDGPSTETQSATENESYMLMVTPRGARLTAPTRYGILHGMETFLQLLETGQQGFQIRSVTVQDHPRFPWRGLLIDACRHWMPVEVIKRNLDAMAVVKLNVLHWHLSEDQAFRVECKAFPRLHNLGSDGDYYTQNQVREIVAYARDRGIRVLPEFDVPGHTTAWFVGYPELASAPGPYELQRGWGVFDPAMNPANEGVYRFLDTFVGEMGSLFPDPYFHIGGDEVNGKQWNSNPEIVAFKRGNALKDNRDLQAYFNRRLSVILRKHGKKLVGWDEILEPDLPADIVIQSWRGQKSLAEAVGKGYSGVLSSGYYLDHILPASSHYQVDPIDKEAGDLSDEAKARILGGEACMWSEFVTPENIDSRIWPRAAAIAERLWSPAHVNDIGDMYRRLEVMSQRLEWAGVTHRSSYDEMLRRLTMSESVETLRSLADVLEPVKLYERLRSRTYTRHTPLHRLVDAVRPESDKTREFSSMVDMMLSDSEMRQHRDEIQTKLREWAGLHEKLKPVLQRSFLLREIEPLSEHLSAASRLGLSALAAIQNRGKFLLLPEQTDVLNHAGEARAELLIMVVPAIRKLVEATR